jgi:SSS family transporter
VLGGFLAVSVTDMIQACFMIFALVLLPVITIVELGGLDILTAQLQALDPDLVDPFALGVGAGIGFLGIGLGSPGNPHILARYMSIDDPEQLRFSAVVGTVWNVVMAWGAVWVGLAGRAYFPDVAALPGADTENLYPLLAQQHLHPMLFGVVLASIFAAIMSTADSQLLVAASAVVRDVYEKGVHRGESLPQRRLVTLSRVVVTTLVALAVGVGLVADQLVFWIVLFSWAGLGAALGPTSILALFWKGTTRAGVMAGLVTGTAVTIVWYFVPALKSRMYELVPAFLLALVVTWLVSRLTSPPSDADELFDAMRR